MRDRIRIAKTAPLEWTVTRPRTGFSGPEITSFTTWADAMGHVTWLLARLRWGSTDTGTDRAPSVTDCLNPISPWPRCGSPATTSAPDDVRTTTMSQNKPTATATASATAGGVSVGGLLLVAFVVLKLTGFITWSWWWVLAPAWIPAAILVVVGIVLVGGAVIKVARD